MQVESVSNVAILITAKYGSFLQLRVPFFGVPIIGIIVYWGLYWGPLILGNYHMNAKKNVFGGGGGLGGGGGEGAE